MASLPEFGKGTGVKGSEEVDFHSKHTRPRIFVFGRSRQSLKACVAYCACGFTADELNPAVTFWQRIARIRFVEGVIEAQLS